LRGSVSSTRARAYLDHNATSPLGPAVREALVGAFDLGNPSSIHREGRLARAAIEGARRAFGVLTDTAVENVVFTSGATEALNMALRPYGVGKSVLLVGATEHLAVCEGHGYAADVCETLPVDGQGLLRLEALRDALARHAGARIVVAVQSANNETGIIQPIAEIAALVGAAGGTLVCDAVQSAGKVDLSEATSGADVLVLSAHKFGGPKGVGVLCIRNAVAAPAALLRGGGQERGFRAGTENVVGIVGAGVAATLAAERAARSGAIGDLRDAFEGSLRRAVPEVVIFGSESPRLPNTTCFAVPALEAQLILMALDVAGVSASSGSACTSGKVKPSHVLAAMGIDPTLARGAVRVSLGPETVSQETERVIETLAALLPRTRRLRAVAA
jgi:cysteine desulfurase